MSHLLARPVALDLVNNFAQADPVIMNAFFSQFYIGLVQDIFFVLTDTDHKSGTLTQSRRFLPTK